MKMPNRKIDKNISESLGIDNDIPPISRNKSISTYVETEKSNEKNPEEEFDTHKDIREDYKLSRETYHGILEISSKAITDIQSLAENSESARMYEVMATMVRTLADATSQLSDLHKKTKELIAANTPDGKGRIDETNISVDKAVFVGTTADLLKQVKSRKKK